MNADNSMSDHGQHLLQRLDAIGRPLERTGHALALLGLGSVGLETERLDRYSDLDFFAIVEPGYKARFIDRLDWLEAVHPVAYCFQNTVDGYKLLFEDGIFCEFAVFEPAELAQVPFAAGRIVWQAAGFDAALCAPAPRSAPERHGSAWLVGEALTNLYVGLCRYRRGEKLSAARFIQCYAVDRVIELSALIEDEEPSHADPFTRERRYEQRFPRTAQSLPHFVQGYERSVESAQAILAFLEQHFEVHPAMRQAVLNLCTLDQRS